MKRKLGSLLAIMMCVSLLAATAVFASEDYEDYLDSEYLASILAQFETPETPAVADTSSAAGQSSDVITLQQRLSALGYYAGAIDGDYGAVTTAAVRRFQEDHGLYVDGIAGSITMAALMGESVPAAASAPAVSQPASSGVALVLGSAGAAVKELQSLLSRQGYYSGIIDGDFGSYTDAAVRSFQAAHGLYVDGVAGPLTMAALRGQSAPAAASSTSTTPRTASSQSSDFSGSLLVGSTGNSVKELQNMLKQLGYYSGTVDGDFGSYTDAAVRRFQQANGLYVDGVVGSITYSKLKQNAGSGQAASPAAPQTSSTAARTTIPSSNGQPLFNLGDISADIYTMQYQLRDLGYDVEPTAVFDQATIAAVREFQRVNGLNVDGIYGSETANRLNNNALPYSAGTSGSAALVTGGIASHVQNIIANATNDSMSQDQKLQAVYDYIANRSHYTYSMDRIPPYTGVDWPVVYANDMINNGHGDCHGMAALFGYAAKMLGYDAYWCNSSAHSWVEINGRIYDPLAPGSSSHATVFGWTHDQAESSGIDINYEHVEDQGGTFRYIPVSITR